MDILLIINFGQQSPLNKTEPLQLHSNLLIVGNHNMAQKVEVLVSVPPEDVHQDLNDVNGLNARVLLSEMADSILGNDYVQAFPFWRESKT
jgi:hypothetical protein